ncbi:hypothetical protein BCAH1134_C0603 (plasmid) [Bacillus cereus AH1134]|nr:hypothetical protein BCAH1134_C0603 [Bacillus cereus AH1134]
MFCEKINRNQENANFFGIFLISICIMWVTIHAHQLKKNKRPKTKKMS